MHYGNYIHWSIFWGASSDNDNCLVTARGALTAVKFLKNSAGTCNGWQRTIIVNVARPRAQQKTIFQVKSHWQRLRGLAILAKPWCFILMYHTLLIMLLMDMHIWTCLCVLAFLDIPFLTFLSGAAFNAIYF